MARSLISVFVLVFFTVLLGGCVPQNQFVIYNNVNVRLRVEIGGALVAPALEPGKNIPVLRQCWADGQVVGFVATGFDENNVPVGMYHQELYLISGNNGTPFRSQTIVVDYLSPIRNVVPTNPVKIHN